MNPELELKYRTANKELAIALGWIFGPFDDTRLPLQGIPPQLQDPKHPDSQSINRWHTVPDFCGKWDEIAPLIFRHGVKIEYMTSFNKVCADDGYGNFTVAEFAEHGGDEAAIRYAAVVALTRRLKLRIVT